MSLDDYLTPQEVSAATKIAVSTLSKARVYGGGIPFVKIGRSVRYRRADIDAFMAERVISSTSEITQAHKGD